MNTPRTGDLVPARYTGGSLNGRSFDTQRSELRPGQLTVSRSGVDEVYTYEVFEERTPNERWEATITPTPTPGAAQA